MERKELDGVTKILETVLKNLRDGGSVAESVLLAGDRPDSLKNGALEAPVLLIVAGGLNTVTQYPRPANPDDHRLSLATNSAGSDDIERKVSHPGLERFTIGTDTRPPAPKACFMEPGRPCVNSGACEMRGY